MSDTIRCSRCETHLPSEAFSPSNRTQGSYCRDCQRSYHAEWSRKKVNRAKPRECKRCSVMFDRWQHYKHPGSAATHCQPCYLELVSIRRTGKPGSRAVRKRPTPAYGVRPPPNNKRWIQARDRVFAEETHCGFCGEYVDKGLPHKHKRSAVIDHIVPLSQGGAGFARNNLRLAHRGCNSSAGNRAKELAAKEYVALVRAGHWIGSFIRS